MLALIGAHRTGKTSLARAVAEKHELDFVTSSASAVYAEMGLDPALSLPFEQRIQVQHRILDRAIEAWGKPQGLFITDRSPLDMAAYLLADVNQGLLSEDEELLVEGYLLKCMAATNNFFQACILVPPAIPFVVEPGKPSPSKGYQEHINVLIMGLLCDERVTVTRRFLPRPVIDMKERIEMVEQTYMGMLDHFTNMMQGQTFH